MIAKNGNYWHAVREIMTAFPETLESTSYGTPAYKVNKKLGETPGFSKTEDQVLTVEDIVGTIAYLIQLTQGKGVVDDIDIVNINNTISL